MLASFTTPKAAKGDARSVSQCLTEEEQDGLDCLGLAHQLAL